MQSQSTGGNQRVRRRAAGRPAERQGDPRAGRAGGAVHPHRGRRRQADRGRELRPSQARPADGGGGGGLRGAAGRDGAAYSSLVLNRKGLDRALQTSTTEIHVAYPVTDTFAQRNQNTTVEEAARTAEEIIGATDLKVTATISVAFGCPFEGHVDPGLVIEHAHRMAAAGADEVILADTIGVGVPRQVRELVPRALEGGKPVGLHMHNTRNTGYANAMPGSRPARRSSTPPSAASAAVRSRRGRRGTSPPRTRLPAGERGRRDGDRPRRADRRRRVARGGPGRDLPGLVQRAGNFAL